MVRLQENSAVELTGPGVLSNSGQLLLLLPLVLGWLAGQQSANAADAECVVAARQRTQLLLLCE
jgi:hypothetical protein